MTFVCQCLLHTDSFSIGLRSTAMVEVCYHQMFSYTNSVCLYKFLLIVLQQLIFCWRNNAICPEKLQNRVWQLPHIWLWYVLFYNPHDLFHRIHLWSINNISERCDCEFCDQDTQYPTSACNSLHGSIVFGWEIPRYHIPQLHIW